MLMPINEKIMEEIKQNPAWDDDFKKLLIDILYVEEKGYRYKKEFEALVEKYLNEGGN